MDDNRDPMLPLEKQLSYWKAYFSVQDVLASELAYSLIFDNIRPDRLADALATVRLTALPNRFFLIQVDDYHNYSSKLHITQEFFQKATLIKLLREYLRRSQLTGFVANLVGEDKIICFLCCQDHDGPTANEYLLAVAEGFKACIHRESPFTISICISECCTRLAQYSTMYPRMNLALSMSYFSGKEFSIFLEDVQEYGSAPKAEVDLNEFYPDFLISIARQNREQFLQVMKKMLGALLVAKTQAQGVKLEMIRLIQRSDEYCIRCGVPEGQVLAFSKASISKILTCSFITDADACLREYYEQVARSLEVFSSSEDYTFRMPVAEYIAQHYHETIRLGHLAAMMGFSEGHFARTFREKFGKTFVQYLTDFRIEKSKELLAGTKTPIEQIADQVGINSYSYFCTRFKAACGLSPGAYRKAIQEAESE